MLLACDQNGGWTRALLSISIELMDRARLPRPPHCTISNHETIGIRLWNLSFDFVTEALRYQQGYCVLKEEKRLRRLNVCIYTRIWVCNIFRSCSDSAPLTSILPRPLGLKVGKSYYTVFDSIDKGSSCWTNQVHIFPPTWIIFDKVFCQGLKLVATSMASRHLHH